MGRKHWEETIGKRAVGRKHWEESIGKRPVGREQWEESIGKRAVGSEHWEESSGKKPPVAQGYMGLPSVSLVHCMTYVTTILYIVLQTMESQSFGACSIMTCESLKAIEMLLDYQSACHKPTLASYSPEPIQ